MFSQLVGLRWGWIWTPGRLHFNPKHQLGSESPPPPPGQGTASLGPCGSVGDTLQMTPKAPASPSHTPRESDIRKRLIYNTKKCLRPKFLHSLDL